MVASIKKDILWRTTGAALLTLSMLVMSGCGDVYLHEEFEKLTMNKSESDVTETLGKPVAVDASNPAHVLWTYYAKTFNIDNENKRDIKEVLIFEPDTAT